jgi:integrase
MSGHIRRRGARSWELKYDVGTDPLTGKRRVRYASFKGTRREADLELARLITANVSGQGVDPSKATVAEFLHRWQEWANTNVSPKTAERYSELVRLYIVPHVGAMPIQKLRPAHLVELYAILQRRGGHNGAPLAPRTVGSVHRVLRRSLGHATGWNVISSNPAAVVKPPRVPSTEIGILTEEQIAALLRHLNGRTLRPIVSFLLGTGTRRGEALALRWQDVDLNKGLIRIERSLEQTKAGLRFKSPKTRLGRRGFTISPWLVAELRAQRIRQDEPRLALGLGRAAGDDLVFARWDGKPRVPFSVTRDFGVALRALGIEGRTLHSLRHTHVSQLIASGMDILTISRRIGHASAAITLAIYGHLMPGSDDRAAAITEAMFARVRD